MEEVERQRRPVVVLQHNCKVVSKNMQPLPAIIRQQNGFSQTPPHFEYWNRLLVSREELLGCRDFVACVN